MAPPKKVPKNKLEVPKSQSRGRLGGTTHTPNPTPTKGKTEKLTKGVSSRETTPKTKSRLPLKQSNAN